WGHSDRALVPGTDGIPALDPDDELSGRASALESVARHVSNHLAHGALMSERALAVLIVLAFGIVAWQSIRAGTFPPEPYRFVGIALVMTVLGVVALASPALATVLAVAVILGIIIAGTPELASKFGVSK